MLFHRSDVAVEVLAVSTGKVRKVRNERYEAADWVGAAARQSPPASRSGD